MAEAAVVIGTGEMGEFRSSARIPWRSAIAIAVIGVALTSVFLINLCDLIYDCGCRSMWAGGVAHCNINDPNSRNCPWCTVGEAGYAAIYMGVVLPQTLLAFWPFRWRWWRRLTATLLAFPVAGGVIGLAMGLWTGYWS